MIGKLLSHYRITGKLGRGGMGEVYRADDTNLSRNVAIKVLPDEFAQDAERLARFQREAQALASLSHPNIATLYDLEESDRKRFIVMELVEGQTLAQRLQEGPIPVEEALEVCGQIAEGLEAAHEKGVVHRDLKPANVMITPGGKVKILDFGLALADQEQPSGAGETQTLLTRPGVVLGTTAYMSPEQAKGKPSGKRADIWAFGCILYECLTGRRAFDGETDTDCLASIIEGEPDWEILPAATPSKIKDLLHRCLHKDPGGRQHDIGDARIEIAEAAQARSVPVAVRRPARVWILAAFLGGLVLAAAAALIAWHLRQAPSPPIVRSVVKIESQHWLGEAERPDRTAMAFSSEGQFLVYNAIPENPGSQEKPQIYFRKMDQGNATPIAGTQGGICAFLSPDDQWIGFWEGHKLKKVPVGGGVPTTLCDATSPFGADWGQDNTIVFSPAVNLGLSRISREGGKPEILTVPDKSRGEYGHRFPHFLPNGRGVLFTVRPLLYGREPSLALLDLRTQKWQVVMENAADGRYLRTGHLVFLREGTLMGVAFDLDRLQVKGQPVPVVANVMEAPSDAGQYSVSNSGYLAYVPGGIVPDRKDSLARLDQNGNVQPVADLRTSILGPRFSPDGQRIAYQTMGKAQRVWIYDLNRGVASQLTAEGQVGFIAWTPDGKRLVFGWSNSGPENLYWQPVDGSSPMERLAASDNFQSPGSFSPDGTTLAFVELHPENGWDILLLDMKSRRITPFLNSQFAEIFPEISPDGRWLAYASNESGRREVWVRPFPGPGSRWQISTQGGDEPIWGKDGTQLFYRQADQVWVADVRSEGKFSAGKPRLLFEQRGFGGGFYIRSWDLWPDGRGFLMVKLEEKKLQPTTEMILVQNWFDELRRLVPTR